MRILLNNIDYSTHANLDGITLELGFNGDNTYESSVTSNILFKKEAAELIRQSFYDDCDIGIDESLTADLIVDTCGGVSIPLDIVAEGVSYCPNECELSARIVSIDNNKRCYKELDTKYILEDGFTDYKEHAKMPYAVQPDQTDGLLYLIRAMVFVIAFVLLGWASFFERVCNILNSLPGVSIDCPDFPSINEFFELYDELLAGTGRRTPVYLVRDIFTYHPDRCGLTFKSSIFNEAGSQYYNTVIWAQQNLKGLYKNESGNVVLGNEPQLTIIGLANYLKQTFPGTDFRIIDGCFYFERLEFFQQANVELFNIVTDYQDTNPCYTFNTDGMCRGYEFSYARDGSDIQGNKLMNIYSDTKVFEPSDTLKRLCTINSPFSPARFMFDCETGKKSGLFDFDYSIDLFRSKGRFRFSGISFLVGIVNYLIPNQADWVDNVLIIQNQTAANYKLLVLEDNYDVNNAKVEKVQKGTFEGEKIYYYNQSLYYDEAMESGIPELINNFGDALDPRKRKNKMLMEDFTIKFDCDLLNKIMDNKLGSYFSTHYGKAFYSSISIDFDKCLATFKGIEVWC